MEVQKTNKDNGVILHGITITEPGSDLSPCIYLNEAYEDYQEGRDFNDVEKLIEFLKTGDIQIWNFY